MTIKIDITTQNIGGDEELFEALSNITNMVEEGEVAGRFTIDGEPVEWSVNGAATDDEEDDDDDNELEPIYKAQDAAFEANYDHYDPFDD